VAKNSQVCYEGEAQPIHCKTNKPSRLTETKRLYHSTYPHHGKRMMAHITKDTVMSKHTTPLEAMGLGGASALLLEAIQALFPHAASILPLSESSFVRTSAIMLGAVALTVIINHFRSSKEDDTTDDADDESNTPFL
jgi:hypothetical protein